MARSRLRQGPPIYDWQLTNEEIAVVRGLDLPVNIRNELDSQVPGQTLLIRTTAMRKLRMRMMEERELADEQARYQGYLSLADKASRLEDELAAARVEVEQTLADNRRLRHKLESKTAEPALAESARPTR